MIQYLNDGRNSLEYTNKDGVLVTKNPFDPEYPLIAQRLSEVVTSNYLNQQTRRNYEQAVANAQISINAGRPAEVLPPAPDFVVYPEDYTMPKTTGPWVPSLAILKPAPSVTTPQPNVPIGPDSPLRPQPAATFEGIAAELVTLGANIAQIISLLKGK